MQEYLASRLHKISAAITYCVADLLYAEGGKKPNVGSNHVPEHLKKQLAIAG